MNNQSNQETSDMQIIPGSTAEVQHVAIVPSVYTLEIGPKPQVGDYFFAQSYDLNGLGNSVAFYPLEGPLGETMTVRPPTIVEFKINNYVPISLVQNYTRPKSTSSNQAKKLKLETKVKNNENVQQQTVPWESILKPTPDPSNPIMLPIEPVPNLAKKMDSPMMTPSFESKTRARKEKMNNGREKVKRSRKPTQSARVKAPPKPRVRKKVKKVVAERAPMRPDETRTESFQEKFGSWNPEDDRIDFDEIRLNLIEAGDELGYVDPNGSHDIFAPLAWDVERDEWGMAIDPNEPVSTQGQFDVPFPEPHQTNGALLHYPNEEDYDPYTFVSVPLEEITPFSQHRIF